MMCGLVACYNRQNPQSFVYARQALALINHRGMDESSYFEDDRVFLGHNRLSIVDIQTGQQPFFSSNGQVIAIINGEIYNAPQLRQQLALDGIYCKSLSDGEVIVGLYQRHGNDFISLLDGEFAFVIWDRKKGQMLAGRDRMGVKPLYYTEVGQQIFFASEIKALKALGVPMRWNINYVQLNQYGIYHPEETCFEGIYALSPGHSLSIDSQHKKIRAYYELSFKSDEANCRSDEDYFDEFKILFSQAVKKRLQSDVPIACYLSGGIDSTSVLAMANRLSDSPLDAFTIAFVDNCNFNEDSIAQSSADYLGSRLHCLEIRDADIASQFQKMVWHGETLAINAHSVAMMLLAQQIQSKGYKVMLGGHGADEFLGGYAFYQTDMEYYVPMHANPHRGALKGESNLAGLGVVDAGYGMSHPAPKGLDGFKTSLLSTHLNRQLKFNSISHGGQMDSGHQLLRAFFHTYGNSDEQPVYQSMQLFTRSTLQGYILSMVSDRMEMAHGIEGRVPFLDQDLCDFVLKLPLHLKINQGREKYILREAMQSILPPWVYQRKKQPFAAPPANQAMHALMRRVFHSELLANSPFYKQDAVIALLVACPQLDSHQQVITDSILLHVLSSCLLQDAFNLT